MRKLLHIDSAELILTAGGVLVEDQCALVLPALHCKLTEKTDIAV